MKAPFETRPNVSSLSRTGDTKQSVVLPDILLFSKKRKKKKEKKERKKERNGKKKKKRRKRGENKRKGEEAKEKSIRSGLIGKRKKGKAGGVEWDEIGEIEVTISREAAFEIKATVERIWTRICISY